MSRPSSILDRLVPLVIAQLDDEIQPQECEELESLVCQSDEARRLYVALIRESVNLKYWSGGATEVAVRRQVPMASPVLGFLGATWSYLGSSEALRGYLAAAMFMGAAMLGAMMIRVSHEPPQLAREEPAVEQLRREELAKSIVAHVTGEVEARWQGLYHPVLGHGLLIGMKLELVEGLVEITYRTGAKVILEGPAKFEVKEADSLGLEWGRLVAKVEGGRGRRKAVVSGQWPVASEGTGEANSTPAAGHRPLATSHQPLATNSNPQSPIPNPSPLVPRPSPPAPLFTVRTPTVTIADLGTEFAVHVSPTGMVSSHVFVGQVRVAMNDGDDEGVILGANDSVEVQPSGEGGGAKLVVRRGDQPPEEFVRALRPSDTPTAAPASGLIANWKFNEGSGRIVREGVLGIPSAVQGPAGWSSGPCGPALEFAAAPQPTWIGTRYNPVGDPQFRKHFTVSVWVKVSRSLSGVGTIVDHDFFPIPGKGPIAGFYAAVVGPENRLHFGVHTAGAWRNATVGNGFAADQWRHLAYVFDSGATPENLRVYLDGNPIGRTLNTTGAPLSDAIGPARLRIGRHRLDKDNFCGAMRDLAIWNRSLSTVEIRAVRQLSQHGELRYGALEADCLLALFGRGAGSQVMVAGRAWSYASGLEGRRAGDLWLADGRIYLQLDEGGNGVVAPQPGPAPDAASTGTEATGVDPSANRLSAQDEKGGETPSNE